MRLIDSLVHKQFNRDWYLQWNIYAMWHSQMHNHEISNWQFAVICCRENKFPLKLWTIHNYKFFGGPVFYRWVMRWHEMTLWKKYSAGWQLVAMATKATLATLSSSLGGGHTPVAPRHRQVTGEGLLHVTWRRQETKCQYKVFNFGKQCLGHSLNAFKYLYSKIQSWDTNIYMKLTVWMDLKCTLK